MIQLQQEPYMIHRLSKQLALIILFRSLTILFLTIQPAQEEWIQILQWVSHGFIKTDTEELLLLSTHSNLMDLGKVLSMELTLSFGSNFKSVLMLLQQITFLMTKPSMYSHSLIYSSPCKEEEEFALLVYD